MLEDGSIAIYAGDIEAVENTVGIGLPFAQIGKTERESTYGFDYAVLDMTTPEGQAAYEAFISGGGVPTDDGQGITTATSEVHVGEYDLGVHVDLGVLSVNETLNTSEYVTETLTYADGSQVTTFDAGYNGNKATQVVVPHGPDGELDFDQAEITLVLGNLSQGDTQYVNLGFDGDTSGPVLVPEGRSDVQLTFTPNELLELQVLAQQAVLNYTPDDDGDGQPDQHSYEAALERPRDFTEEIAAAGSVQELIEVIINNSPSTHDSPVSGLTNIAVNSVDPDSDQYDNELPGSIEIRPAQ